MAVDADEMSFKRESWFFAAKKKRAKEWKVRSFDSEHFNSLAFPESRALSKQNSKDFCGGSIITTRHRSLSTFKMATQEEKDAERQLMIKTKTCQR